MSERGTVVWAPDPFRSGDNPRPWLVLASYRLPYPDEESVGVALTTQSHHPGSIRVPTDAWIRGKPGSDSHVLPWTLATLKEDLHVVGVQGDVSEGFVERVVSKTVSYLEG